MSERAVIECRDVRKSYASRVGVTEALHGASAHFSPGAVNALVGPSGCGKSTLLRLLAGLDAADGGTISVLGRDLAALDGAELRRLRRDGLTYVAQRATANLVPHLRLRDHFERPSDVSFLEPLGLATHADSRPGQLSGGEQARAAVAVAIARRTPVLLFDEPTAELDRTTAAHVIDALRGVAAAGRTVVVATHDPDLIAGAGEVVELADPQPPARERDVASRPATRREPVLAVRSLTKRYGDTHAVDDVSLDLSAGETGVVLGRSGSGKSTLLMLLGGWLSPDSGETGVESTAWDLLGYLPQRFGLLPELTVRENVGLALRVAGVRDDERVQELLERLALAHLAERPPGETSVGQQQRVALARALVRRPRLLLADEPTSHQDRRSAARVWDALGAARAAGTACLVATHDSSAAAHADRVWEIVDGRLSPAHSIGSSPSSR